MKETKKLFTSLLMVVYFISGCSASKNIRFECPNIETDLSGLKSNGSLILDGDGTYLMDMDSLTKTEINKSGKNLFNFSFSPDRKWIVYLTSGIEDDFVMDVMGENQVIKTITWEDDWAYVNWLNEEQLIIPIIQQDRMSDVSNFLVLNLFTDERYTLSADYPDMLYDEPWRIIEYSPVLDSVVYLQGGVSGPFHYTLWDIQNKTALAQLNPVGDMHVFPRWSSDGSQFSIALSLFSKMGDYPSYEIFRVLRDGTITQLTHLSDYYPWVYVGDLSWSPNSRYIAFLYSHWSDEPDFYAMGDRYLGVLDVKTKAVTNYCIRGALNVGPGSGKYPPPLWSPDSKQVVIQSQIGDDYVYDSQTILVNIQTNKAYLIGEALEPVGWLNSP